MRAVRLVSVLAAILLLGSGCTPTGPGSLAALKIPAQNTPKKGAPSIPCLAFSNRDGFSAWVDQYAKGTDAAKNLAKQIHLPANADPKFIANVQASLQNGASASFVCALSDDGKNVAWVMEPPAKQGEACRDDFYVLVNDNGTTSEVTSSGGTTDCHQLCKPKRFEPDLLVWQCDPQTASDQKTWTQMNLSRASGEIDVVKCQKDKLGMPAGCVE